MLLARRWLVMAALAFWQGGFAFYAVVVVPVGQQVLGSHTQQGFVTRRVTNYLNVAGCVAAVVMLWEIVATRAGRSSKTIPSNGTARRIRLFTWVTMLITLLFQCWLHARLERLLDDRYMEVLDDVRFYAEHRWYLLSSAAQWLGALGYVGATLALWRSEDQLRVQDFEVK